MALDTKELPKDAPPPITAQEIRDHAVMEELLATKPELQEKGIGHAVSSAWNNFKFSKSDWVNSIGFGAIFGVAFGTIGWGIGAGLESLLGQGAVFTHMKDLCGMFGVTLGVKSAITHPFADMTKDFYDKCKEGLAEAREHNKALGYLRDRMDAIKMYKQNNFMRGMMESHESVASAPSPAHAADASLDTYENPRSHVVDAILAKKREALSEMSWADRTQAGQATTQRSV